MKPYYEHGGITIYHGDCRDVIATIEADLVVTDPPYGMNYRSNYRAIRHQAIAGDAALPLDLIQAAIARANRAAYVFCRWDNLPEMPAPRSVLAWVKNNWTAGDLEHEHGRQWEACCFYPQAAHAFVKRIPDVIVEPRTANDIHPTQKPVPLIKRILAANTGSSVFDPFMGSGTTLVAAKELGWKASGVELEERYCEAAAKRLSQECMFFG